MPKSTPLPNDGDDDDARKRRQRERADFWRRTQCEGVGAAADAVMAKPTTAWQNMVNRLAALTSRLPATAQQQQQQQADDDGDPVLSFRNIAYAAQPPNDKHNPFMLDVYVRRSVMNPQQQPEGGAPVIVNLHGGAWLIGDKDIINVENNCYLFARRGYVSVSIKYTLSSISNQMLLYTFLALTATMSALAIMSDLRQKARVMVWWLLLSAAITLVLFSREPRRSHRHPSHVMDVAMAARWVRDHAHLFGGDTDRRRGMAVVGHSAGAHLAALLVTNPLYLQQVDMSPRDFFAAVCMAGVYNDCRLRNNNYIGRTLLSEAFGGDRRTHTAAFPIHHCDPTQAPPFFLLNAGRDISLKRHAKEFRSQLLQNGVYCDSRVYPSTNHYNLTLEWQGAHRHVLEDILSFLERAETARQQQQP